MSFQSDEAKRERYFALAERKYQKEVNALFVEALDEIRAEMSKIYEKYAVNGVLTKAQMTRYNRLATLEKNMVLTMKPVVSKAKGIISRLRPEEYGEAFFRTAWAFDNEAQVALSWGTLNYNAVKNSLENVFHEVAVKNWGEAALANIRVAINKGLALGQSYPAMARDLKNYINAEAYKIFRILRTELHAAQEAGTADAYNAAIDNGIDGKVVWISTLDGRTRDTHASMDGKARDDDGLFHGSVGQTPYPGWEGLPAEERINCRCSMRFEIDGFAPVIRRSREDGIIPYQAYPEWIKGRKIFA